jgi:chromosomal replication initiation ATPase DnaA
VREPAATYQVAADAAGPLTPAKVVERWPDFLNALRPQDLKLEALMRSCEPVGVEEDVVVLSFAHKFHRSMVEEDEKRHLVEDTLSDLFGRRLRVRCVISRQEGPQPVQEVDQTEPVPRPGVSEDFLDPLVQMAVDELGAEVASR